MYNIEDRHTVLGFSNYWPDNLWLETEKRITGVRLFIEFLLYISITASVFPSLTGLDKIPYALGGIIVLSGMTTFFMMLILREGISISIWFSLIMNIGANLTQMVINQQPPIVGEGLTPYFIWWATLTMVIYLVQNNSASKRILFFYSLILLVAAFSGAAYMGTERLEIVKGEGVTMAFGNANQLAHISAVLAIGCLFWSLESSKILRPLIWLISALLVVILIRTVSRGGILVFGFGGMMLILTILMAKGKRIGGVVLIFMAFLIVLKFGYSFVNQILLLKERFGEESVRTSVYSMRTLKQILDSVIFGNGPATEVISAGITPHNSFLYSVLCFGGITAIPYVLWLIILSKRVWKMFWAKDYAWNIKFLVISLFVMSLGSQLLSNQGFIFFSSIYAIAITEKYTSIYSRKKIKQRNENFYI